MVGLVNQTVAMLAYINLVYGPDAVLCHSTPEYILYIILEAVFGTRL